MKFLKVLVLVLSVAVGMPALSASAADGHQAGGRAVASAKKNKKAKGKKGKHAKAKGKKKGAKLAKNGKKKAGKGKKAKKLAATSHHKSHAPAADARLNAPGADVQAPVPSMEIPHDQKDDLPPPNTGNLGQ